MGSIQKYQTKNGVRYRVQYRDPNHRARTESGFTKKAAAAMWDAENELKLNRGTWIDPQAGKRRVDSFWDAWWATKQILEPGSIKVMKSSWETHVKPVWGRRQVSSIRKHEVQQWLAENKARASTFRRAHGILAGLLDIAVETQCIPVNPARGVTLPRKPQPRHVYYSMEQLLTLSDECSRHNLLVLLLGASGPRWGEAVGIQPRDLNPGRRRVHLQRAVKDVGGDIIVSGLKGHENRSIAVPQVVMDGLVLLSEGLAPDGFIFTDQGQPLGNLGKNNWFDMAVRRLVKRGVLAERITVHGLRHVAAGLLVSSGANVKAVQRQLGHKSAAMTLDTYAELFDGDLDEIADVMDESLSGVVKLSSRGTLVRALPQVGSA